jgi:hypothetical protein
MLSNKRKIEAQTFGIIIAYDLFIFLLNSKNRGSKFDWNNFVNRCKRLAFTQLPLSTDASGKMLSKMQELAVIQAEQTAIKCLKESGINGS